MRDGTQLRLFVSERGSTVVDDGANGERHIVYSFGGSCSIVCSSLHLFFVAVVESKYRRMLGGEVE